MSKSVPLVSAIIPVYNRASLVAGAIRSVLQQTHCSLEVLVVDDGSTDHTAEVILQVADERVRLIQQANCGTATARNTGLAAAKGEFIAFLDADDRWLPRFVELSLEATRKFSQEPCFAYSGYIAVDEKGRLLHFSSLKHPLEGCAFEAMIDRESSILAGSSCLFDRRIYEAIGGFEPDDYHEDYTWTLRVARRFPFAFTGKRLWVYRQSAQGKARRLMADYDAALKEDMAIVDAVSAVLSPCQAEQFRNQQLRSAFYRWVMYGYLDHAKKLYLTHARLDWERGKKGRLAVLSIKTGLPLLSLARRSLQTATGLVFGRWWQGLLRRYRLGYAE